MTLCIAAVCDHEDKRAIVICADWQGTHGQLAKSEDVYKIRHIAHSHVMALLAGDSTGAAEELYNACVPALKDFAAKSKDPDDFDLRMNKLLADLRAVVHRLKRTAVENYLASVWGLSHDEFFKEGSKALSSDIYLQIWTGIQDVDLSASVIFAYADDAEPVVIRIDRKATVHWEYKYSAIGTGQTIATAILCQEDYDFPISLNDCMGRVLLAKKAAERDLYVGKATVTGVLVQGEHPKVLTEAGWNYVSAKIPDIAGPKGLVIRKSHLDHW